MRDFIVPILRGLSVVAVVALAALPVRAEDKAKPAAAEEKQQQQIDSLIKQLGSDDNRVREAASIKLSEFGMACKDALTETIKSPDLEVRVRAKHLLAAIVAEDFQRRLQAFADDTDGKRGLEVPGWSKFKQAFGGDAGSRDMFVAMQRAESGLLEIVTNDPKQASEALSVRYAAIKVGIDTPGQINGYRSLETIATLLYVASDPDVKLDDDQAMWLANLTQQPVFIRCLNQKGGDKVVQGILNQWLAQPIADKSSGVATLNLQLAWQVKVPQAVTPALQILAAKDSNPMFRQLAILVIGQYGSQEHLAKLEPFLQDATKCTSIPEPNPLGPTDIQVRDLALAAMIHLTRQDPKDYGYEFLQTNEHTLYQQGSVGFKDSDKRETAFKKWAAWKVSQKK